jgi:hypothetical protein
VGQLRHARPCSCGLLDRLDDLGLDLLEPGGDVVCDRDHDELRRAGFEKPLEQLVQGAGADRHVIGEGELGPPPEQRPALLRERRGRRRGEQRRPVVIIVDLAPCRGRRLDDLADAIGELGRRDERAEPAVGDPARAAQGGRARASEPDVQRRPGRLRREADASKDVKRPSNATGSPGQSSRTISIVSSVRAARSPRGTPITPASGSLSMPRPNAGSSLPPDSASTVASSLASRTGFRAGATRTLVPSFRCCVRAAIADRAMSGAGPPRVAESESQIESNPSPSMCSTIRRKSSGARSARSNGLQPMPTRTLMRSRSGSRRLGGARRETSAAFPVSTKRLDWLPGADEDCRVKTSRNSDRRAASATLTRSWRRSPRRSKRRGLEDRASLSPGAPRRLSSRLWP